MQTFPECEASKLALSERAYVGSLIATSRKAKDSGLTTDDFSVPLCREVFSACLEMEQQGVNHDLVTLSDRAGQLDPVELISLSQEFISDEMTEQHIENIRDASQRRSFVRTFNAASGKAMDWMIPFSETVAEAKHELNSLSAKTVKVGSISGTDALMDLYSSFDKKEEDEAIRTGIPKLDEKCRITRNKLVVVGARPSVGKSALMSFIATNAVLDGKHVLYISLEMDEREVSSRMLSFASFVDMEKIDKKTLEDEDYTKIVDSLSMLKGENFRISTTATTPEAIRREAVRMIAAEGLDIIFVDYIQLLRTEQKTSGRVETVGEITRALKLLALELHIPVVAASQVNRASAMGGEERAPRLAELRESGSIEQDADIVLLLHAPKLMDKKRELIIAKNRQGTLCGMELIFDGAHMRFLEVDRRYSSGS